MENMQQIGRLAMRKEGGNWNAYYALPDSMLIQFTRPPTPLQPSNISEIVDIHVQGHQLEFSLIRSG